MEPDSMAAYLAVAGELVIVGKEPDGDSVRFRADDPGLYQRIPDQRHHVDLSADGTVQLRFEGVDAPEAHYQASSSARQARGAQPLGIEARDALLARIGFSDVRFAAPGSTRVVASSPATVRALILTRMVEVNGRPVAYLLLDEEGGDLPANGTTVALDQALLDRTLNVWLLRQGLAYLLLYSSNPPEQRARLRALAAGSRGAGVSPGGARGPVWLRDASAAFVLDGATSIGPGGQPVFPKLFRRAFDYVHDVERHGFAGTLVDWLLAGARLAELEASHPGAGNENDQVSVAGGEPVRLADLLQADGDKVSLSADVLDLVFVEK